MWSGAACALIYLVVVHGTFSMNFEPRQKCLPTTSNETFFDFTLDNVYQNDTLDLGQYRGQVVLLVNTATYCGSVGQLVELNALQEQHGDEGLQVIAVPCNQLLMKEPAWDATELMAAMKYVRPGKGYVPNFPFAWTVDVNGENEHPLYTHLKAQCPPVESHITQPILYNPVYTEDVRWNFEKFLIGSDGRPVYRYSYLIDPATDEQFKADVMEELGKVSVPGPVDPMVG